MMYISELSRKRENILAIILLVFHIRPVILDLKLQLASRGAQVSLFSVVAWGLMILDRIRASSAFAPLHVYMYMFIDAIQLLKIPCRYPSRRG